MNKLIANKNFIDFKALTYSVTWINFFSGIFGLFRGINERKTFLKIAICKIMSTQNNDLRKHFQ